MDSGWMRKVRDLSRQQPVIAIALVTLVTLALVGLVLATTTSVGCSFIRSLAANGKQCPTTSVAIVASPTPTPIPSAGSQPSPFSSPIPPFDPGTSSNPPYNPGASSYPPFDPAASPGNPPSSDYYPPLPYAASGSNFPGAALTCRLPVYAGGPGSGGFIVFPSGTFVADPRSTVSAPSPSPGSASPTPPPYGGYVGWWGSAYDAKYSKWLPVPYSWVSPDGSRYAYPLNGDIYVQSVSGGAQLELGEGRQFAVLDVENDGVYVVAAPNPGLWFLPYSGAAKQITASGFWHAVSHGAAYGTATSAVPQGATNTILKLDLSSGAATPFFSTVSAQSQVTGFDAQGHPIIQVSYNNGVAIFIATGPNTAKVIAAQTYGTYSPPPFPQGRPIADAHGIWYQAGNGIVLFANGAWYPMSNIGGQLAGQCL